MKAWLLVLLAILGWGWAWYLSSPRAAADKKRTAIGAAEERLPTLQGAASCAAGGCHHGNAGRGIKGSEYTTWIDHDPHSKAYDVLLGKQSAEIAARLNIENPQETKLCLNCHVRPNYDHGINKTEGVSCESCHGPAEKWRAQHYREDWKKKNRAAKARLGMTDTKSLVGRARVCVACHVGAAGSDVNHDLLAAGHPPLHFEFAAYHANLPRHWSDAQDKDAKSGGAPDFEARAWAVGQLVVAEASLRLLADRAETSAKPWPEFAEYDCHACHHPLQGTSWRQTKEYYGGRRPGAWSWGSWYHALPPRALNVLGGHATLKKWQPALQDLKNELEKPRPERKPLAIRGKIAADVVKAFLDQYEPPPLLAAATLFRHIVEEERPLAQSGWLSAGQVYLSLAALHDSWKDLHQLDLAGPPPPHLAPLLRSGPLPDPSNFHPARLREKMQMIRKHLDE